MFCKILKCSQVFFVLAILLLGQSLAEEIEAYFAPNGGFNSINRARKIELKDGKLVDPLLDNALLDLIQRTEDGGTIKIAMYAFNRWEILDALIDAAMNRDIKVKLLLDAVADWTKEQRDVLFQKVDKARQSVPADKKFDFQIKEVTPQIMTEKGRTRILSKPKDNSSDETTIYGTMHEKFGIFYDKRSKIPMNAFCGSSNISPSAEQVYAENRIIFKNSPGVARQLAEEFARLWNEYAIPMSPQCTSEMMIPVTPSTAEVRIIFNGKPKDEDNFYRIDEELINLMKQVWWKGTIDIAIFSFTHLELANAVLDLAGRKQNIQVRILMDQTQIQEDPEDHIGVLGPYIEEQAKKNDLKNIEIRYKWRSNAFAWDEEKKKPRMIHWRNLLLHHKLLIVNNSLMATGSYNWSSSAEIRNLENMMFFNSKLVGHENVIAGFAREYNEIWNCLRTTEPVIDKPLVHPKVIHGPEGRALRKQILEILGSPDWVKIMGIVEKSPDKTISVKELLEKTEFDSEKLDKGLDLLFHATLLGKRVQGEETFYFLAD